jgi:hypothetical protein
MAGAIIRHGARRMDDDFVQTTADADMTDAYRDVELFGHSFFELGSDGKLRHVPYDEAVRRGLVPAKTSEDAEGCGG